MSNQPKKTAEEWAEAYFSVPNHLSVVGVLRQAMQQAHREGLREAYEDAIDAGRKACVESQVDDDFTLEESIALNTECTLCADTESAIRARSAERLGEKPDA